MTMPAKPKSGDKLRLRPLATLAIPPRVGRVGRKRWIVGVAAAALPFAYAVSCLYRAYLAHVDMGYVHARIDALGSVSLHALADLADAERAAADVNLGLFYTVVLWMVMLDRRLDRLEGRRLPRWLASKKVWRLGVLASLAVMLAVPVPRAVTGATVQAAVSADETAMTLMAVWTVVGLVYACVAFNVARLVVPTRRSELARLLDV